MMGSRPPTQDPDPTPPDLPPPSPLTPRTLAATKPPPVPPTAADPNPFATTFVQADSNTFKQVVQILTGSPETAAAAKAAPTPKPSPSPPSAAPGPKKPVFKLYERRTNHKLLSPLLPGFLHQNTAAIQTRGGGAAVASGSFSPRGQHPQPPAPLSPSVLDFPSLALSPVTPLVPMPGSPAAAAAEARAIAEKGFYLHPSPRGNAEAPPRLLPLFPVTSPRAAAEPPLLP